MKLARAALVAALLASCAPAVRAPHGPRVREITPGAFVTRAAFDPGLAAGPGGRLALTYVTRDTAGTDVWLALSADSGEHFSLPVRLNARRGKVSSFPESHPVAAFGPAGQLVVAWAATRDSGRFADDVAARASTDGGATFEPEVLLNDDHGQPASPYHGFVALDATPGGRMFAIWIDGRDHPLAPGEDEPSLAGIWSAASDDGGRSWRPNVRVADSVCPCCRPALRAADAGPVAVAYRGVRDTLRDPRLALSHDGGGSFAFDTLLSADGWKLNACPVSGPALSLAHGGGFVAWTTGAEARTGHPGPGLYYLPWQDGRGATGNRRLLAEPALEAAHALLVSRGPVTLAGALVRPERARHALGLRTLAADGRMSPWLFLGVNARSATLAAADRHAYAAWIEQGDTGPRLRVVRVTLE